MPLRKSSNMSKGKSNLQMDSFVITCPKSKTRNIRPPMGKEDRFDLVHSGL